MISIRRTLRSAEQTLEGLNHAWLVTGSIFFIVILGLADFLTGFELAFSLFYVFPVFITAWFVSRNTAFIISFLSALTWVVSNALAGEQYSNPAIGLWNALIRFGTFAIFTLLLAYLRQSIDHEKELSRIDFITGITNSRAFYQLTATELLRARRYEHPFSFAYIDLDDFKLINDRLGHNVGDEVLKVVATTLKTSLRRTDIVARLGGDEFGLFLPESDQASANAALIKVRTALLDAMENGQWEVTFSIGVITFQYTSPSMDEVIHKVDQLMYSAKAEGKNRIRFAVDG